jgi:oxygen-independent coproporphyrinogen III oxidase
MLALRSSGIDLKELGNKFDLAWYKKNKSFLKQSELEGFIKISNSFIKLTPKGYAICDEIIARLKY